MKNIFSKILLMLSMCFIINANNKQYPVNSPNKIISKKPGTIGSFCTENDDCSDSSFCCSKSRCDIGFVCATGLKLEGDSCEFKYECASRCCQSNHCAE